MVVMKSGMAHMKGMKLVTSIIRPTPISGKCIESRTLARNPSGKMKKMQFGKRNWRRCNQSLFCCSIAMEMINAYHEITRHHINIPRPEEEEAASLHASLSLMCRNTMMDAKAVTRNAA
mmetsp:Transcript_30306/g.44000  ORF Transcript_30306/g.44000 Transcript_30306/m.44000 type:complete len:119 (+) Transcript_30306:544-900(+)